MADEQTLDDPKKLLRDVVLPACEIPAREEGVVEHRQRLLSGIGKEANGFSCLVDPGGRRIQRPGGSLNNYYLAIKAWIGLRNGKWTVTLTPEATAVDDSPNPESLDLDGDGDEQIVGDKDRLGTWVKVSVKGMEDNFEQWLKEAKPKNPAPPPGAGT